MQLDKLNAEIDGLAVGERLIKYAIPEHIYHQSNGIGSSLMAAAFKSMAHYKHAKEKEREPTPDMIIGSAVHYMLLEPEFFDAKVIKLPDGIVRGVSKKYKEFAEKHPDKLHLKPEELETVTRMFNAILAQAGNYFQGGEPEVSYWFKHESGLILKARLDYRVGDGAIDLKTTRKEDSKGFARAVKYDYAVQDAHYRLVTQINDLLYLGVSKSEPHTCHPAYLDSDIRAQTEKKLAEVIRTIAFAEELGEFDYPPLKVEVATLFKGEQLYV